MKKNLKHLIIFISIIILTLPSTTRASIINFKKCAMDIFDKEEYEEHKFEIDLKKKIVKEVRIRTDKHLKINKEILNKILNDDKVSNEDKVIARGIYGSPKIYKFDYIIDYEDKNYITARGVDNDFNSGELETNITIYLKEKSVHSKSEFVKKNRTKIPLSADGVKYFCK